MTQPPEISPQEKLIASRRAIVRYMRDGDSAGHGSPGESDYEGDAAPPADAGKWQFFKHAVHSWWQHHPAQLALSLGKPTLSRYAEEKPLRLLGIAAVAGAAAVWIRPWRLVSITSLLLATLKSSEVSALALSLLSSPNTKTSKQNND
ncbi:MAG: hypothetical protein ABIP46_13980 [Polaromonas sp.]